MIDLHAHILPGLDDGAQDMDETIEMCLKAAGDGIETIVATPHMGNGTFDNHREVVLSAVAVVNNELEKRKIPVKILPGGDNYINEHLDFLIQRGEAMTVNDNGRYVMVEFPKHIVPPHFLDWLFEMKLKNITPILTHPERHMAFQNDIDIARQWVDKGGLIQITAMSLLGEFGPDTMKSAEELLRYHLVHIIASDAHSKGRRPPVLSEAIGLASQSAGFDYIHKLVNDFPAAIIAGESFDVPEPIPKKLNFFMRFFGKF